MALRKKEKEAKKQTKKIPDFLGLYLGLAHRYKAR